MANENENIENSEGQVESAIKNEMDEIGPGEMPEQVKEEEKEDK